MPLPSELSYPGPTVQDMKTCGECKIEKPVSEYYFRSDRKTLRGTCKSCWSIKTRQWQKANPERVKAHWQTSQAKLTRRERSLRDKFGMTQADFDAHLEKQGGACAICHGASGDTILHVDHCHDTGAFRGILCGLCNRMLGQGKDDPARLRAGADYLDAFRLVSR